MNQREILTQTSLSISVKEFINEASDLYVGLLSDGRRSLAASLLSGLVLAVATLEKISNLAPGPERSRQMGHAAALFHRLSLLIFVSAIYNDDEETSDPKTQSVYDAAADLSGRFASAARRAHRKSY